MSRNQKISQQSPRKHIVVIMHSTLNLKFFWIPILEAMSEEFLVTLYIQNDVPEVFAGLSLKCRVVFVPIKRKISPVFDLKAMIAIYRQLRRDRPDLVQTVTPKAGLLGMLACTGARVPIRIHTFQGQVWANARGIKRWGLRTLDRCVATLSTGILADSQTQLEFLRKENVLKADQGQVLGSGSITGVDLVKFNPNVSLDLALQRSLGLNGDEFVFLYLGRLQRDKGIHVLAEAYALLLPRISRPIRLIVVGPDEDNLGSFLKEKLGASVTIRPFTDRPAAYLRLANVTVLPSFREGFGSILIEAAAMGVPAIASRIYGIDCAVVDGETGLLFEPGNAQEMAIRMENLLGDPKLIQELSKKAMSRAFIEFDQKLVVARLVEFYCKALNVKKTKRQRHNTTKPNVEEIVD